MKLKRTISILAATVLSISMVLTTTGFAASEDLVLGENVIEITVESSDGGTETTIIDLNKTGCYQVDANGDSIFQIFGSFSEHTINSGSTMYYTGSGNGYTLDRGQKVTVKASFDKSISWECGYSSSQYTAPIGTGSSSSINKSVNMPADGTYKFYIKNKSSSTVTVKSGSITY
ncbi:hypothetical protein DFR58_110107 [Anaerobacterium chartisolvens]|uniref:Uncharacterized protein n=1 Tax=Anaerobacterium chartisolvens TaxID=1297424 RepID=A0A369B515_9FIRM|nr:hypothetical protein [Anaerobacterium chartisolvens]RCX16610.1 hypothetical protein DFR58_110107 [Anaerobacterium chartisolvens]